MFHTYAELWEDPFCLLRSEADFVCEMSNYDHAFLCGLLKEKKPKKLLEIGIAEGGTTAVIANCMSMLGNRCEIYSVDLSETLYYDCAKKTGYEYARLVSYIDMTGIMHKFLIGRTIGAYIETIGNNIDFAVIDTTHELPGEVLDLLCILPFLAKDATVVLHDVNLNYMRAVSKVRSKVIESGRFEATKLLFSAVSAKKYLPFTQNSLQNIAAFTVSEDTYKNAADLFYLLTATWEYVPEEHVLNEYRKIYERFYEDACLKVYDIAVKNNREISKNMELAVNIFEEDMRKYRFPYHIIPNGSRIALYGAGNTGKDVCEAQKKRGLYQIVSWVDKKYKEYCEEGLAVESPAALLNRSFDYIVVAVEDEGLFQSIQEEILRNGWHAGKPILGPISRY